MVCFISERIRWVVSTGAVVLSSSTVRTRICLTTSYTSVASQGLRGNQHMQRPHSQHASPTFLRELAVVFISRNFMSYLIVIWIERVSAATFH